MKKKSEAHGCGLDMTWTTEKIMSRSLVSFDSSYADIHAVIPFDEIERDGRVRVVTIDGVQYLSIRDILMYLCVKDEKQAGAVWRALSQDIFKAISAECGAYQFPGKGNKKQAVITFSGAYKMIALIPEKDARKDRADLVVAILQRFAANNPPVVQDTEISVSSDGESVASQFARASLVKCALGEENTERKRKRDLEGAQLRALDLKNIEMFSSMMDKMDPSWRDNEELRTKTVDWLKDVVFNDGEHEATAAASGERGVIKANWKPITLKQVAQEEGYTLNHSQLIKIGRLVIDAYRAKFGAEPFKHKPGMTNERVKLYPAHARGLIKEKIAEVME